MDFYPFKVTSDHLQPGLVRIDFKDVKSSETYDLREAPKKTFLDWVEREFGYLRYSVRFG